MKVFPDTNIWVSAFATHGLCETLVRQLLTLNQHGSVEIFTCPEVLAETRRILIGKFDATEDNMKLVDVAMSVAHSVASHVVLQGIPDPDDAPIIAAALAAHADVFVTGDKALLELGTVEALPIIPPREMYERLQG